MAEELRFALVMNGGVSLAVWMGGVTNEIHRLVTGKHAVYRMLLDMTQTTARVDVISGTSAGGVNGAALALALAYDTDFSSLRSVWIEAGAFDALLRPPLGENPGSLLKGDEFYLERLQNAFDKLAAGRPVPIRAPIDLRLTTTLLTGHQGNGVDDLGSALHDVDYRAYFHFVHSEDAETTEFRDPKALTPKLARAARSTSSFPFAFEPSCVTEAEALGHLKGADDEALALPRYVIDGGILNNKPFEGARKAIFSMNAEGSVRRVLAYINPDPGDGPPGKPGGDSPPLARVLSDGVFGIPFSQTIADQLAAIEDHNRDIRTHRESLLSLARLQPAALGLLAERLYPVYHERRLSATFETFVYEKLSQVASKMPAYARGLSSLGKYGREQMRHAFDAHDHSAWLPARWPTTFEDASLASATWAWGMFPVEYSSKVVLEFLRLVQGLFDATLPPRGLEATPPKRSGYEWSDGNTEVPGPLPSAWSPEQQASSRALSQLWQRAFAIVAEIGRQRAREEPMWTEATGNLLIRLCRLATEGDPKGSFLRELQNVVYPAVFAHIGTPTRRSACAALADRVAALIADVCVASSRVLKTVEAQRVQRRPFQRSLVDSLRDLTTLLHTDDERQTLYVLMAMEVIEFSFRDHEPLNAHTPIELVQISGNGSSPLGGPTVAKDKLLGLQLAHFGAFYKSSWRVNDWTYGRLQGAERLVRILLDAERLYRHFHHRRAEAVACIKAIALDSIPSERLAEVVRIDWAENGYEDKIRAELAFLDSVKVKLPDSLPNCASVVTLRLHYGILAEELPHLFTTIHRDQAQGAGAFGDGEALLRESLSLREPVPGIPRPTAVAPSLPTVPPGDVDFGPTDARRWLEAGLLGRESLAGQAGTDLLTRTLAQTTAALQNTLSSKAAALGPVSLLFASLKVPIIGFYFACLGLLKDSRTGAVLNGAVLATGMAIVVLALVWGPDSGTHVLIPHGLLMFGWALLAYGLLVLTMRAFWLVGSVGLVVACAVLWMFIEGRMSIGASFLTVLLVAAFMSAQVPALQWVIGIGVVLAAAIYSSAPVAPGALGPGEAGVPLLALAIVVAIVVAALSVTVARSWSLRLKRRGGSLFKRIARRLRDMLPAHGPRTERIEVGGLTLDVVYGKGWRARPSSITVAGVTTQPVGARVTVGSLVLAINQTPLAELTPALLRGFGGAGKHELSFQIARTGDVFIVQA